MTSKYQQFLNRNIVEIETIFDERSSNVINGNGEVLVEGKKIDLLKSVPKTATAKYREDESIFGGLAANSSNYFVYCYAGREVHTNSLGVRFFKYFTELKSYQATPNGLVACPSTFTVDSGSGAGFVQKKNQIFSAVAFSYPFISGYGTSVRFVGGNKNTPYIPGGIFLKGNFSTSIGGVYQNIRGEIQM